MTFKVVLTQSGSVHSFGPKFLNKFRNFTILHSVNENGFSNVMKFSTKVNVLNFE